MNFVLDENVPASVAKALIAEGHTARFIRDHIPPGSPDQLVAAVSEQLDAILVSFDGDFQKIAPRVPKGARLRFRKLCRIYLLCNEPQAAARLCAALTLIDAEYKLSKHRADARMMISLSNGFIKTHR